MKTLNYDQLQEIADTLAEGTKRAKKAMTCARNIISNPAAQADVSPDVWPKVGIAERATEYHRQCQQWEEAFGQIRFQYRLATEKGHILVPIEEIEADLDIFSDLAAAPSPTA